MSGGDAADVAGGGPPLHRAEESPSIPYGRPRMVAPEASPARTVRSRTRGAGSDGGGWRRFALAIRSESIMSPPPGAPRERSGAVSRQRDRRLLGHRPGVTHRPSRHESRTDVPLHGIGGIRRPGACMSLSSRSHSSALTGSSEMNIQLFEPSKAQGTVNAKALVTFVDGIALPMLSITERILDGERSFFVFGVDSRNRKP